jgi:hypothetical protein
MISLVGAILIPLVGANRTMITLVGAIFIVVLLEISFYKSVIQ